MAASKATPSNAAAPRLLILAVEMALAVLIALLAAQAIWFAVYGTDVRPLDLDVAGAEAGARTTALVDARPAAGLFSRRGAAPAIAEAEPETSLNYQLRGVRQGADPEAGAAVIEIPGTGQRLFRAGEELAPGVVLAAVHAERVVLDRRGLRESLYLTDAAARRARAAGAEPGAPSPGAAAAPAGPIDLGGITIPPAYIDGRLAGADVTGGNSDLLDGIGLAPGDRILEVDGRPLSDAASLADTLQAAQARGAVTLSVLRDGETVIVEASLAPGRASGSN